MRTYSNEVGVRMTYVFVELELNLADYHNLSTVMELYSTIVGAVRAEDLVSSNFNKYWSPDSWKANPLSEEIFPRISVRVDVKDMEAAKASILGKADELVRTGRVRHHGTVKDWNEPDLVVRAHELGTNWAVIMAGELRKDGLREYLQQNREKFLLHLLLEALGQAGLKASIPWTYLRPQPGEPPVEVKEAAILLGEEFRRAGEEVRGDPDFLERFLHAFLNCMGFSGFEGTFLNLVMTGRGWGELASGQAQ